MFLSHTNSRVIILFSIFLNKVTIIIKKKKKNRNKKVISDLLQVNVRPRDPLWASHQTLMGLIDPCGRAAAVTAAVPAPEGAPPQQLGRGPSFYFLLRTL